MELQNGNYENDFQTAIDLASDAAVPVGLAETLESTRTVNGHCVSHFGKDPIDLIA